MAYQLYRHFDGAGQLLYVGISMSAFRRLSAHEVTAGWFPEIRTITITPYRTRTEAAAAEVEAIKTERPKWNQQHAENPVKPPVAPAMAGKALRRRLAADRRKGEDPGKDIRARIDAGLAMLRQKSAATGPGEPQEGGAMSNTLSTVSSIASMRIWRGCL